MCQSPMKVSMGKYRILSAKEPQMSAAVMMAKVSWYTQYTVSGMAGASWCTASGIMFISQALSMLPITGEEGG